MMFIHLFCEASVKVRLVAPEFYDDLLHHTSWVWVLYKFLTDPALGPYARIKHKASITPFRKGNNMLWPYIDGVKLVLIVL